MKIGIPKEIKNNENRVAVSPASVMTFVENNIEVCIETGAGLGSGFTDEEFEKAGATIVGSAEEAWTADVAHYIDEHIDKFAKVI